MDWSSLKGEKVHSLFDKIFRLIIEMRSKISRIPEEVLKEIFPKKFSRYQSSDSLYPTKKYSSFLNKMT